MKSEIICICGESGSGKTTIAEILQAEDIGYNMIDSHTTRKPRYKGERGHIFSTVEQYKKDFNSNNIAADTLYDKNFYWTTKDQLTGKCIYVIDCKGVEYLKKNCPDKKIIVIYLKADKETRLYRMLDRNQGYEKTKERIAHDDEAFRIVKADYIVDSNRELGEVIADVKSILALECALN